MSLEEIGLPTQEYKSKKGRARAWHFPFVEGQLWARLHEANDQAGDGSGGLGLEPSAVGAGLNLRRTLRARKHGRNYSMTECA